MSIEYGLTLYECGICCCYHQWGFNGDCREDANRFGSPEDFAEKTKVDSLDVVVLSWQDRLDADGWDWEEE